MPLALDQDPPKRRSRRPLVAALGVLAIGAATVGALALFTDLIPLPGIADESDDDVATSPFDSDDLPTQSSTTTTTEPTTTSQSTTTTESTTTTTSTTTSTPTTIDDLVAGVSCSVGGDGRRGTVTGVEDWVTMRTAAGLSAGEVGQVPAASEVVYFLDSIRQGERFEWIEISAADTCGWVASKFVKNVAGQVVGTVDAVDYVHRALRGLEAEALYAEWTIADPAIDPEQWDEIPIDRGALDDATARLRALYLARGTVDSAPDPSYDDGSFPDPGCSFSDFLHCGVLLLDGNGNEIGQVNVSYIGNGITNVFLDLP